MVEIRFEITSFSQVRPAVKKLLCKRCGSDGIEDGGAVLNNCVLPAITVTRIMAFMLALDHHQDWATIGQLYDMLIVYY